MNCWICNTELIWGGDHDFEEDETHFDGHTMMTNLSCPNEPDYDGHTIVTNLSCPKCGAFVEVYHGADNEE